MNDSLRQLVLHLSLINGVGPALCKKLYETLGAQRFLQLYEFNMHELLMLGITQNSAQLVFDGLKDRAPLEHELSLIGKHQISLFTSFDENYPALLKEIHLPPLVLYCKGALPTQPALAVVGSRQANLYGERVINQLVPQLIAHGFAIVSGGALGADAMAHRATVKNGGMGVVVLGSGLLRPYPATHKKLFEEIVSAGGALVSPFGLEVTAAPGNFPARNRVISGLSLGCLVIQAAQASGAKITALFSLEQGREVFAVPGPIDDLLSVGCHELIAQGAKLVQSVNDIVSEFPTYCAQIIPALPIQEIVPKKNEKKQISADSTQPLAQQIIAHCQQPQSVDDLVELLGVDLNTVQAAVFDLQLCGKIEQGYSGLWQRI